MSYKEKKKGQKIHFNTHESNKLQQLAKENPYIAVKEYQTYFENYPKDYTARVYYITSLIATHKLEEAEVELENLENELEYLNIEKQDSYITKVNRVDYVKYILKPYKLSLYLQQGEIEKAIAFYNGEDSLKRLNRPHLHLYLKKLKGTIDSSKREGHTYLHRQIIDYQLSDFIDHIQKHLSNYEDEENDKVSYFQENFPINSIITEMEKYIPSDIRLCQGIISNSYFFRYNECGRDKNKMTDYFVVKTFINSRKYITMYPILNGENYPYVDLNYLKTEEKPKVKVKISQIDKFRNRYGNKY